jgi:hypothetical protein
LQKISSSRKLKSMVSIFGFFLIWVTVIFPKETWIGTDSPHSVKIRRIPEIMVRLSVIKSVIYRVSQFGEKLRYHIFLNQIWCFSGFVFATTKKLCCAPIPAIFVSYPNPKLKGFQKEPTTRCSVQPFLMGVLHCSWQTYSFLAVRFVYIACLNRICWINWFYYVFVQLIYNRAAHFCNISQFFLGGLNFVHSL